MIDLQGTWAVINRYAGCKDRTPSIIIDEDLITFGVWNKAQNKYEMKTARFQLVGADYLLGGCECNEIEMEPGDFPKYDFVCHVELIQGQAIPIISEMTMEYDGRGRIVFRTYMRQRDIELVNEDFESKLSEVCNHRPVIPMNNVTHGTNNGQSPMSFMGMGLGMGMGMMNMNGGMIPGAPGTPTPGKKVDPWDCSVCGNKGNTGKFCPECGSVMPKKEE